VSLERRLLAPSALSPADRRSLVVLAFQSFASALFGSSLAYMRSLPSEAPLVPSRLSLWAAHPRCPGTTSNVTTHSTNHGLAKGTTKHTVSQHLPCDRPMAWRHDYGGWVCPDPEHKLVLSGEEAASSLMDTIEIEAVKAA
jgi:hypothetical protein